MANVLVVKLGALGDLLLADGALRDIREHHADDRIVLLTRAPFATLMQRCPWVDEVVIDGNAPRWRLGRMRDLARRLRGFGFSRVYDLQNSRRSAFYRRWLLRMGDWHAQGPSRQPKPPVLERHAALLSAAGVPTHHARSPHPSWLVGRLSNEVKKRLTDSYVVLLPGSSARHRDRRWPGFRALAEQLSADGVQCVCVPGPDELEDLRDFPGVVLLDGGRCLDLPSLAAVLARSTFVVGNDSGPTHLAAHLGCRGLVLHGPGSPSPETTGILRGGFKALRASQMASIPVDEVFRITSSAVATPQPDIAASEPCTSGMAP